MMMMDMVMKMMFDGHALFRVPGSCATPFLLPLSLTLSGKRGSTRMAWPKSPLPFSAPLLHLSKVPWFLPHQHEKARALTAQTYTQTNRETDTDTHTHTERERERESERERHTPCRGLRIPGMGRPLPGQSQVGHAVVAAVARCWNPAAVPSSCSSPCWPSSSRSLPDLHEHARSVLGKMLTPMLLQSRILAISSNNAIMRHMTWHGDRWTLGMSPAVASVLTTETCIPFPTNPNGQVWQQGSGALFCNRLFGT